MSAVLNHIEDLQVACFAVIFGLMVWQSPKNQTIRFAWLSYALASVISVMDVVLKKPSSPLTINIIFTIISVRYAVLSAALAYFTRGTRWLATVSFGVAAIAVGLPFLRMADVSVPVIAGLYYVVLAPQLLLMAIIVLRPREKATRIPRVLLGSLFLISVACRCSQAWVALFHPSAGWIALRDDALFVNSTVVGCLLPFTIVWMMNARVQRDLLKQSLVDPLTDLLNRRGLADAARRELARYARARQNFAVAVLDIDHFKQLNDAHGHAFGDQVLQDTAKILRDTLRLTDIVTRSGGEEFVLLLPLTPETEMISVLERVRMALERRAIVTDDGHPVHVTASIGVTNTRGRTVETWTALQGEADDALYEAKRAGRNRTVEHRKQQDATFTEESYGALPTA